MILLQHAVMIWSFATLCNFDLLAYHGIFDLFWSDLLLFCSRRRERCVLGGGWVQSCQLCRHFAARWIRPVAIGLSLKPGQISNSTTGSTRINKANKEYMESDYDMIIIMIIYDYIIYDIILWFMIHDGISGWCQVHLGGFTLIYLEFVRFWLHEC